MEINLECSDIFNEEYSQFMDNNSQICLNEEGEEVLEREKKPQKPEQQEVQNEERQETPPNILGELAEVDQQLNFFKNTLPEEPKAGLLELSEIHLDQSRGIDVSVVNREEQEEEAEAIEVVETRIPMHVPLINFQQPEIKGRVGGAQMMKPPQVPTLNIPVNKIDPVRLNSTQNFPFTMTQGSTETKNSHQQLSSTATSTIPCNKQWQKVTISKRRPTTASQEPSQASAGGTTTNKVGQRSTSTSVITKPKLPINFTNMQQSSSDFHEAGDAGNHPRTYRERLIASPCVKREDSQRAETQTVGSRRRKNTEPEILPVFDCLFCCQEHFVLSKQSENTLSSKYALNLHYQQRGLLFLHLSLATPFNPLRLPTSDQPELKAQAAFATTVRPLGESLASMTQQVQLVVGERGYETPVVAGWKRVLEAKRKVDGKEKSKKKQVMDLAAEISEISSDGFDEVMLDGTRQVRLKTRRQRIIENISFETECFNIYDPHFTSEEDNDQSDGASPRPTTHRKHQVRDPSTSSIDSLHTSQESVQKGVSVDQLYPKEHSSEDELLSDDKSLSSIEKRLDDDNDEDEESRCFEGCNLQLQKVEMAQNSSMKPEQHPIAVFSAAKILNIQENKFTPDQDVDRDSQRYTFGCITPQGVNLGGVGSNLQSNKGIFNQISSERGFRGGDARNDPFLIEHGSQLSGNSSKDMHSQLRIVPEANQQQFKKEEQLPEVHEQEPMMSADQSPISCQQNGRTIQDFSPIILDMARKMERDFGIPTDSTTGKQLSRIKDQISKINFNCAQQLMESLELPMSQSNLTRIKAQPGCHEDDSCDISLKQAQQSLLQVPMRNKAMHAPHQSVGGQLRVIGDKDSCFSPIQHDNSLSREGVYAAVAVREAIQDHYFNTNEDDYDITMAQDQEYQQSNHMFGERDIAMTSKFPNRFDFQGTQNEYFSSGGNDIVHLANHQANQEAQTLNMGYPSQSQSFSAFNSKHVDHTPQANHKQRIEDFNHPNVSVAVTINPSENLITESNQQEPCSTARGKKKGGKKLLIKQEQLSVLLQKALEKRNSQTTSNIIQDGQYGNNTVSSDFIPGTQAPLSLFDSIIKQGSHMMQNQSQLEAHNPFQNPQHQVSLSHLDHLQPVVAVSNQLSSSQKHFQPLPKHKKKQKTCDFNKPQSIGSSAKPNQLTLNSHQSAITLNDKRAPKFPGTTVGQNTRKVTHLMGGPSLIDQHQFIPINSHLEDQQFSRQPIMPNGNRGKNYHLSFNNVVLGSNQAAQRKLMLEMNPDPEADRPLTLRNNVQEEDDDFAPNQQLAYKIIQKNLHNLAVSPNLLLKATKNLIKKPPQMTREEMAQYLKSAISSSRYSSSSILGGGTGHFKPQNHHNNSSQNRLSHSTHKGGQSPPTLKWRDRGAGKPYGPLLTDHDHYFHREEEDYVGGENPHFENTLMHQHNPHLSIDQQTTVHKSSAAKLLLMDHRRDSVTNQNNSASGRGNHRRGGKNQEAAQRLRMKKSTAMVVNMSAEKRQERVGKQSIKSRKSAGGVLGSKERKGKEVRRVKGLVAKKEQNQMEFQSYLNLCNSINFSNDVSLAKPTTNPAVSTSLISHSKPLLKKDNQMISTSLINDGNFTSKGGFYSSNAQNSSSIIISGHQHHYYHNTNQSTSNLNIQDSSQNMQPSILCGAPMTHTSNVPGNEMSTTISGNQLSLTRMVSGGDSRPGIKGNQTISSGPVNVTSGSGGAPPNMNQTTVISSSSKHHPKVIVPALQLNRIKSNSTKRKQLNGSHDEIQLQNLLQNLNLHLQANQLQMQTRASVLKDGSNTVTTTPHGGANITSSFQRGIAAAAAAAQLNMINTKRSQGSSLSLQRQSIVGVSAEAPRKESIEQYRGQVNRGIFIKQLNQTAHYLKKKQDGLPMPNLQIKKAIQTAAQKDRRKKSKDQSHPPLTVMPSSTKNQMQLQFAENAPLPKKGLQNSFTLKQLKLMTTVGTDVHASQQLTGRMIETQRATEQTASGSRPQQNTSIQARAAETCLSKDKISSNSQKMLSKLVIKNQKNIMANSKAHLTNQPKECQGLVQVSNLNRSSVCPTKNNHGAHPQLHTKGSGLNLDQALAQHSSSTLNLSALLLQQHHQDDVAQSARCFYDTACHNQQQQQIPNKLQSPMAAPRLGGLNPQVMRNLAAASKNPGKGVHNQFSLKTIFAKKTMKPSASNPKRMEQRESIQ